MKKKPFKKNGLDTICVDSLTSIGSLGTVTSGNIPHLSKGAYVKMDEIKNSGNGFKWKFDSTFF